MSITRTKLSRLGALTSFGAACACLGFLLALSLARAVFLIDYDTGAQIERFVVGPITVREMSARGNSLAYVYMANGRQGLSGRPNWHTACAFSAFSRYSPNYEGGAVAQYLDNLQLELTGAQPLDVSRAKEGALRALSEHGVVGLKQFIGGSPIRSAVNR
jgi:hypothetical protein